MDALKIENLRKVYASKNGERVAVAGLNLCVADGEMLGLLGANGAGKSTTIKMATGLTVPTSGSVRVYGIDMFSEPEKAKEMVNVSPQETAIAPNLTVKENLEFIAAVYGKSREDARVSAEEIMKQLGLIDRAKDRAEKLSGGLKRRLSIAMALITQPKLLFLDEPTLGLDVLARRELWRFIKHLKGKISIVLTTHYLEEAEALCDRIAVLHEGELKALGTAEEIVAAAKTTTFEEAFMKLAGMEEYIDD